MAMFYHTNKIQIIDLDELQIVGNLPSIYSLFLTPNCAHYQLIFIPHCFLNWGPSLREKLLKIELLTACCSRSEFRTRLIRIGDKEPGNDEIFSVIHFPSLYKSKNACD